MRHPTDLARQYNGAIERAQRLQISAKAWVLYFNIFHCFNRGFWQPSETIQTKYLIGITPLSASEFSRCREELKDKGFITYEVGKGSQGATYRLIKLYEDAKKEVTFKAETSYQSAEGNYTASETIEIEAEEIPPEPISSPPSVQSRLQAQEPPQSPPQNPPRLSPQKPPVFSGQNLYIKQTHPQTRGRAPCGGLSEVLKVAESRGIPPDMGRDFFDYYEINEWRAADGRPLYSWVTALLRWHSRNMQKVATTTTTGGNRQYSQEQWSSMIDTLDEFEI